MALMPDHLHALVDFPSYRSAVEALFAESPRKSPSSRTSSIIIFRKEESHDNRWKYIKMNPIRAGLISDPEAWPYVYEPHR
jgi:hypothetical protein